MRRFNLIVWFSTAAICCLIFSAPNDAAAQKNKRQRGVLQSIGDIEPLLTEIADAFEKSDLAKVRTLLQKALKIAPKNTSAQTLAGVLSDREGDYETAEKHFALAAKLAPGLPEARNNYGAILLRLNRSAEAAREFEASLRANPNQSSALVNLAQIRFAENDLQQARELFEKAKTIKSDAEILRALVVISLHSNDAERAKSDFRKYVLKAVETSPSSRRELAAMLLENGLTGEAAQEAEAVFALDPANLDSTILLSKTHLGQKNIKAAGRLLESTVARGIEDARIYATLAEVYQAGKYWENAIPAMRLAIAKDPRNENYLMRYGLLLINAKTPAAAIIRLEEALKEFPDSARLWLTLGIARFDARNTTDARIAFRRALAIEPKLVPAMAYSAMIDTEQGFYQESIKFYERAIAIDEKNALLHYLLGDVLLNIAETDNRRIEKELITAVALDANLAAAHYALGKFYARNNRFAEAAAALEKAVALEPDYADALYQLGLAYAKLKKNDESKQTMAKFKRLTDDQKEQKENDRRELVRRFADTKF